MKWKLFTFPVLGLFYFVMLYSLYLGFLNLIEIVNGFGVFGLESMGQVPMYLNAMSLRLALLFIEIVLLIVIILGLYAGTKGLIKFFRG